MKLRLISLIIISNTTFVNREVKIDVYGGPVTANAKLQVGFSGEVLAVRNWDNLCIVIEEWID